MPRPMTKGGVMTGSTVRKLSSRLARKPVRLREQREGEPEQRGQHAADDRQHQAVPEDAAARARR